MQNIYLFGSMGQDGKLLIKLLKKNNPKCTLILFSKDKIIVDYFSNKKGINITSNFNYLSTLDSLFEKYHPDFIFYFAAVHFSSLEIKNNIDVGDLNNMTFTNYFLPLHIIKNCLLSNKLTKFLFASSSLIFAESDETPQTEVTVRNPSCIYGKQKCMVESFLSSLSSKSNIKAYIAILYNHESIFRQSKFFTKKLISFCSNFSQLEKKIKLQLFNKNSKIDMGYAPEYVDAMYKLVQNGNPGSYIFSTQKLLEVHEIVNMVLDFYKLEDNIINFNSFAPRNNTQLLGINKKISNEINWVPCFTSSKLIYKLCEDFEDYKSNIKLQN